MRETENKFVGYDYKEITVDTEYSSMYLDCYENFGWVADENRQNTETIAGIGKPSQITVALKRDRKILNKMELTRLQNHFEACANEIQILKKSETQTAAGWAITVALIGTIFMAGATFAVIQEPPLVWLCILLAIPGLAGWILSFFVYQGIKNKKRQKLEPLIEKKREEIYEICAKGHSLLI